MVLSLEEFKNIGEFQVMWQAIVSEDFGQGTLSGPIEHISKYVFFVCDLCVKLSLCFLLW